MPSTLSDSSSSSPISLVATEAWASPRSEPSSSAATFTRARGAPGLHRRLEVEHRLEWLELKLDELGAVLGDRLGLGHDHRHRLPGVDSLLARERLVGAPATGADDRQVGRREHRDDTRQRQRGVGPDRGDQRVGLV